MVAAKADIGAVNESAAAVKVVVAVGLEAEPRFFSVVDGSGGGGTRSADAMLSTERRRTALPRSSISHTRKVT